MLCSNSELRGPGEREGSLSPLAQAFKQRVDEEVLRCTLDWLQQLGIDGIEGFSEEDLWTNCWLLGRVADLVQAHRHDQLPARQLPPPPGGRPFRDTINDFQKFQKLCEELDVAQGQLPPLADVEQGRGGAALCLCMWAVADKCRTLGLEVPEFGSAEVRANLRYSMSSRSSAKRAELFHSVGGSPPKLPARLLMTPRGFHPKTASPASALHSSLSGSALRDWKQDGGSGGNSGSNAGIVDGSDAGGSGSGSSSCSSALTTGPASPEVHRGSVSPGLASTVAALERAAAEAAARQRSSSSSPAASSGAGGLPSPPAVQPARRLPVLPRLDTQLAARLAAEEAAAEEEDSDGDDEEEEDEEWEGEGEGSEDEGMEDGQQECQYEPTERAEEQHHMVGAAGAAAAGSWEGMAAAEAVAAAQAAEAALPTSEPAPAAPYSPASARSAMSSPGSDSDEGGSEAASVAGAADSSRSCCAEEASEWREGALPRAAVAAAAASPAPESSPAAHRITPTKLQQRAQANPLWDMSPSLSPVPASKPAAGAAAAGGSGGSSTGAAEASALAPAEIPLAQQDLGQQQQVHAEHLPSPAAAAAANPAVAAAAGGQARAAAEEAAEAEEEEEAELFPGGSGDDVLLSLIAPAHAKPAHVQLLGSLMHTSTRTSRAQQQAEQLAGAAAAAAAEATVAAAAEEGQGSEQPPQEPADSGAAAAAAVEPAGPAEEAAAGTAQEVEQQLLLPGRVADPSAIAAESAPASPTVSLDAKGCPAATVDAAGKTASAGSVSRHTGRMSISRLGLGLGLLGVVAGAAAAAAGLASKQQRRQPAKRSPGRSMARPQAVPAQEGRCQRRGGNDAGKLTFGSITWDSPHAITRG